MKFKRLNLRDLIEADRNYPADQSNARDLGSRLIGNVLEDAGTKHVDSGRGKEAQDGKNQHKGR